MFSLLVKVEVDEQHLYFTSTIKNDRKDDITDIRSCKLTSVTLYRNFKNILSFDIFTHLGTPMLIYYANRIDGKLWFVICGMTNMMSISVNWR